MNSENISTGEEEKPAEIESQFILRLPAGPANALRESLRNESKSLKDKLKIMIDPDSMRQATVQFENYTLPARIYDLPSIIESYKTFDRKVMYKVADICQVMKCEEQEEDFGDDSEKPKKIDRDGRDKRYLHPHGVTPSLKNSRKRRFRKTMRKRHAEAPSVEGEVKMLLKTDAEAISSRFELVDDDREELKLDEKDATSKDGGNQSMGAELSEFIFGHVSSSSSADESDDDGSKGGTNRSSPTFPAAMRSEELSNQGSHFQNGSSPVEIEKDDGEVLFSQQEAETAQQNLNQMLQNCSIEEDRSRLYQRLNELEYALSNLQSQREALESDILSIVNQALRERYQNNIDSLRAEEVRKKAEYEKILASLN